MLKNYKELKVWQKSYQLCLEIYKITARFPKEERFGLTSQIRRAAVSVPSNIAEGYGRKTTADYEGHYCPPRGLGEKPSPLGEDFSSIFCAARVRGVEDSRVRE